MSFITQEEILKIARMSRITLTQEETEKMQSHIEAVLSYAACVQDVARDSDTLLYKNSNVERDDIIAQSNTEDILKQAPEREENYFVVPTIIEASL